VLLLSSFPPGEGVVCSSFAPNPLPLSCQLLGAVMVRSEPGTEHPPREALRPREAVGDVFLARWPSQTERRFVGQGEPVPWPPVPSSSAVAACGRGGVGPASSGAGRAAGLAVRGSDAASNAGAASAGGRSGRAVALRRLLP